MMSDSVSLFFKVAPDAEVVVTAPCIYLMNGAVCIEYDNEGWDVQGFPYESLVSFHITKEITT